MSEFYEKALLKLELDQVLQLLAECAGSQGGKEACLRVRPASGPTPWPLLSGTRSTITAPQLPQDLCGTWEAECQLNVIQAFLCLFRL